MGESELELVGRAAGGDQDAFRELVERHGRRIYHLAYRITADQSAAEDVVQETFMRAHRALHRFDGRAAFSTWLHRIASNAAIEHVRWRRVRQEVAYETPDGVLDPLPSEQPDPEREARSGELRRALRRAFAGLSADERAAFVLRHFEGRSSDEIGELLGSNRGAGRQAVFRAVRKLRQALLPLVGDGMRAEEQRG